MEFCNNCDNKNCAKCDKKKRFTMQCVGDKKCIFDNLTENIYLESDLHLICELLNRWDNEV